VNPALAQARAPGAVGARSGQEGQRRAVESIITSLPGDEVGSMQILVCYTDGTVSACDGCLREADAKARGCGLTRVPTSDNTIQWARDTDTLRSPFSAPYR
jgi:hypothetical protein